MNKLSFSAHPTILHMSRMGHVLVVDTPKRMIHWAVDARGTKRPMAREVFNELHNREFIQRTASEGITVRYDITADGANYIRAWANGRLTPRKELVGTER